MNFLIWYFLALWLFFQSTQQAWAVPSNLSLSGPQGYPHGSILTINGANLGLLNPSEILLWENFDGGSDGTQVSGQPLMGSWSLGNFGESPSYSSASAHRGLSSHFSTTSGNFHSQFSVSMPHNMRNFYISFWYRYHHSDVPPDVGVIKVFQLWGTQPWVNDYDPGVMSGGAGTWFASYICMDTGSFLETRRNWTTGAPARNAWHHFEAILRQSGDGVADGTVILKNDGQFIYQMENVVTRTGTDQYWDVVRFFYGLLNFGSGILVENFVDDAYMTGSWARVEIGDADTYAASTHREIQVPLSQGWSSPPMQVQINRGSFTDGQRAYLYVVDQNGAVNAQGVPIEFGDPAPAAPANLRSR